MVLISRGPKRAVLLFLPILLAACGSGGQRVVVAPNAPMRGDFGFVDSSRLRMKGSEKLVGEMTLRNGRVVWDLNGMSSRDWDRVAK